MPYQFKKEPLRAEDADRLANACTTPDERLVLWVLLDTGLRVSELCSLTGESIQWQQCAIRVNGNRVPSGSGRRSASFR